MDIEADAFGGFVAGEAVANADPEDMRKVWDLCLSLSSHSKATGMAVFKRACHPGADVRVVWYRTMALQMFNLATGSLAPWLHEGRLDEAVFTVAATFPMKGMQVGTVYREFPFDVAEFLKQVESARGNR